MVYYLSLYRVTVWLTLFRLLHCLPHSARAGGNLAESAEQLHGATPKSESARFTHVAVARRAAHAAPDAAAERVQEGAAHLNRKQSVKHCKPYGI